MLGVKVWFNVLTSPLPYTIRMHGLNPRESYGLIYNTMSVDGEPTLNTTHHYMLAWDPLTLTSYSFYEIIHNQTLNQSLCHVTLKRIVTHMATCQVTIYSLKNSNLTFLNLDFSAFCPILAFKCYSSAQLAD